MTLSRLFHQFKFTPVLFKWMFFNSAKEINRPKNEFNRLLSKKVSNICLKVSNEERN